MIIQLMMNIINLLINLLECACGTNTLNITARYTPDKIIFNTYQATVVTLKSLATLQIDRASSTLAEEIILGAHRR